MCGAALLRWKQPLERERGHHLVRVGGRSLREEEEGKPLGQQAKPGKREKDLPTSPLALAPSLKPMPPKRRQSRSRPRA